MPRTDMTKRGRTAVKHAILETLEPRQLLSASLEEGNLVVEGTGEAVVYREAKINPKLPAAPTGMTAVVASSSQIVLRWTDNANNEQGYVLDRSTNGGQYAQIARLGANTVTYSDLNVQELKTYSYRLRAYRGSAVSQPATASATVPLAAATQLGAQTGANVPRVQLHWIDNSQVEQGYAIERSVDGVQFIEVARVGAGVVAYTDEGLEHDTLYTYRVRAFASSGATSAWTSVQVQTTAFHVFENTAYLGRPDLSAHGMERIYIAYENEFFTTTDHTYADESLTRAVADRAASLGQTLVIDIESWPTDIRKVPREQVDVTMAKLTQVVQWIRDQQPEVKLGFYGILPIRDYWTPYLYHMAVQLAPTSAWWSGNLAEYTEDYQAWQAANAYLQPLAGQVDYVFPSLYTFYDDQQGWQLYAQSNLDEAHRYGKPVIPFLWMDYHTSNAQLRNQSLPADYWAMELDFVRARADGMVVWGGWKFADNGLAYRATWDPTAPWWLETEEFLARML